MQAGKLLIKLSNNISLNRDALSPASIEFLKKELNFANSEFFIKKRIGKNTWGTQRYFKSVEEHGDTIVLPRGFIGRLLRHCKESNVGYEFKDERNKAELVSFPTTIKLREYQKTAIDTVLKKDFGVIVAPPGAGKTIIGLAVIAEKRQPALIIVHRKQLAEQWTDRIEAFLGIPRKNIGRIDAGKAKVGKQITVVLIQSLRNTVAKPEGDALVNSFGTIIIDECHHVPAETFRDAISRLNSQYLYGLTATPFRKYNDGKLIFSYIGDVIAEIKPTEIENHLKTRIVIRETELDVPFNIKTDKFETLSRILVHDSARNKLIFNDLTRELNTGKRAIVLTERKDHIDTLHQLLKQFYETVALSGEDSASGRNIKWKMLNEGKYQVLITTGQYFGEGSDLTNAHCIFLVYPFSFEGKLIQYIGRVQRSPIDPVIYDYRDYKIDYLERLFQKRNAYYKKFVKEGPFFDFYEPDATDDQSFAVEEQISILIEELEFRFGIITFKYFLKRLRKELPFEVSNTHIRPEFSVLKPYFAKVFKSQKIRATISVKVNNGLLVYNYAMSPDLEKIDREVVEAVRFRFISQQIFKRRQGDQLSGLVDVQQIQSGLERTPIYSSGEELLDDFLKRGDVKHYYQLRYLAQKHDGSILKLRFVLTPFSFVFLLTGQQMYHVVWETLDTEEATYIWHVEKNTAELRNCVRQIDENIAIIRDRGRQVFLENAPSNFGRILHDYTDPLKGFILWRDMLEERLV